MQNITELAELILNTNGKPETTKAICKGMKKDYKDYKNIDDVELMARIQTDLATDGRFIWVDGSWDLKSRYSILELDKIKLSYAAIDVEKELDDLTRVEKEEFVEEQNITKISGPIKDNDEDDIEDIDEISESILS